LSLGKRFVCEGDELRRTILVVLSFAFLSLQIAAQTPKPPRSATANAKATEKFDPSRDARKDIEAAIAEAQKTDKRIILDVGGEWCVWCHRLDEYFAQHPKLRELREENFIWLKINFSPENENKEVLSAYPEIPGYPHIFVLDENGKLLHSQNTEELEADKSYNLEKMFAFFKKWSPQKAR
jgi:thiol:disulfide interchange protein